jgi:hypothetical protein
MENATVKLYRFPASMVQAIIEHQRGMQRHSDKPISEADAARDLIEAGLGVKLKRRKAAK